MAIVKKASYGGQIKTDALSGKLTFQQGANRIIGKDDDNLTRLLISTNPFVMKISQQGVDTISATDDQLIFNSNNNLFKIVQSGIVNFNTPIVTSGNSGETTESVNHNLLEPPIVIAFITYPSIQSVDTDFSYQFGMGRVQGGAVSSGQIPIVFLVEEEITSTSTDITFYQKVTNATGFTHPPLNLKIKYFIITETIPQL